MNGGEILDAVRASAAEALAIPAGDVTPGSALVDDLGAESIDLLDMLFRLERKTGVKIKAAELRTFITGGMPPEVFADADGRVSDKAYAHLVTVMPQLGPETRALEATKVINRLTVQNVADLLSTRLAGAAG